MIAYAATVESVLKIVASDAPPAAIGHEIIALRRSMPFCLIRDIAPAYAEIANVTGIPLAEIDDYRAAYFADAKAVMSA